ncbi:MAG: preprotein translocase subunit YajC [Candidatus Krumholzibacteria bacterium]|nr:preprotein translocase subunit YajC [Candidatus Krumholzibacteria bacterium]
MLLMNLLAMGSPSAGGGGGGSSLMTMLMFGSIFAIFYFMIIRPQKKQADQRKAMIEAIKRGDKVVTTGGIFGTVKDVKADRIIVTIAEGVKVEVAKSAVNGVVTESE